MTQGLAEPLAGMAIHELINEAHLDIKKDRRTEPRYPFFRQVAIHPQGAAPCIGFTREISARGIGLLHNIELTPGEVVLVIPNKPGYSIRVRTRIIWCEPCGTGWYLSGGQFVGAADMGA